jgi:ribosomal protein L6P/L9E
MLQIYKELDLEIPSEVEVKVDSRVITVKGPRGELSKVSPVQRKGEEQRRHGMLVVEKDWRS